MDKVKLGVILLSLLFPIIIVLTFGWNFKSFSKVWETPLQPLFIIVHASVSFFFYELKRWRMSSVFLMFLVAFSTTMYSDIHNVFAVLFFLSCIYGLAEYKRMRIYLILYCCSVFLAIFGILVFEWGSSYILCFYHLNLFWIKYKFDRRNVAQ